MPVIEDTPEYQIVETVTPIGSTRQLVWKTGSAGGARQANYDAVMAKAVQALGLNATYLALATPSAAQNTAQAKALTRQVNALIKLLLNDLADVNGT